MEKSMTSALRVSSCPQPEQTPCAENPKNTVIAYYINPIGFVVQNSYRSGGSLAERRRPVVKHLFADTITLSVYSRPSYVLTPARPWRRAAGAVMDEIIAALAGPASVHGEQTRQSECAGRPARDLPADDPSGEDPRRVLELSRSSRICLNVKTKRSN